MRFRDFSRYALLSRAALVLLAGCGGPELSDGGGLARAGIQTRSHHHTFEYTGSEQSFKVPAGVTSVTITAKGAAGAQGAPTYLGTWSLGGLAGSVDATIPVAAGERLAIFVGGSGIRGGYNGGAGRFSGGSCSKGCYGYGGGASDVRQGGKRLSDRVVVAAGGGGGGGDGRGCNRTTGCYLVGGNGGDGGGDTGGSGGDGHGKLAGSGGTGGTQSEGGSGGAGGDAGCPGFNGTRGSGGPGAGRGSSGCDGLGGGGGGGYYGGGGAGSGNGKTDNRWSAGGGGGGGSSFVKSSATHVQVTAGAHKGDGVIEIAW